MGKKKKSMASKLAKMSDTERARYLQHKADMEEEAKRRREQLICSFMKNKIKREQAFERLNMAKINQHWHQVLRKLKCKEMKEDVEHMKKDIHRLIELKNKIIEKLMEELEEAEYHYSHNFKSHLMQINKISESQSTYLKKMKNQYEEDLVIFLESAQEKTDNYINKSEEDMMILRTLIYANKVKYEKDFKDIQENFAKKYDEEICCQKVSRDSMMMLRQKTYSSLWRQLAELVKQFVERSDRTRERLAELNISDAQSAIEIANNQYRIQDEEKYIELLKEEIILHDTESKVKIASFKQKLTNLLNHFCALRNQLRKDMRSDESKLRNLAANSNDALRYLQKGVARTEYIRILLNTCEKFETVPESINKRYSENFPNLLTEEEWVKVEEETTQEEKDSGALQTIKKLEDSIIEHEVSNNELTNSINTESDDEDSVEWTQPKFGTLRLKSPKKHSPKLKTAFMRKLQKMQPQSTKGKSQRQAEKDTKRSSSRSSPSVPIVDLGASFDNLQKMEKFWSVINIVQLDCKDLVLKKKNLELENLNLKNMMRAILEVAALAESIPNRRKYFNGTGISLS